MAENRVIGDQNQLPWHLPEDLKHFKSVTMGKPVIMGRLTFESIGKPLPGRVNIVVSRQSHWSYEGVQVAHNLDQAIAQAKTEAAKTSQDEIMVIGGANIYSQALPLLDILYVTEIHKAVEGDARFPLVDWQNWKEFSRSQRYVRSENSLEYSFIIFHRQAPA